MSVFFLVFEITFPFLIIVTNRFWGSKPIQLVLWVVRLLFVLLQLLVIFPFFLIIYFFLSFLFNCIYIVVYYRLLSLFSFFLFTAIIMQAFRIFSLVFSVFGFKIFFLGFVFNFLDYLLFLIKSDQKFKSENADFFNLNNQKSFRKTCFNKIKSLLSEDLSKSLSLPVSAYKVKSLVFFELFKKFSVFSAFNVWVDFFNYLTQTLKNNIFESVFFDVLFYYYKDFFFSSKFNFFYLSKNSDFLCSNYNQSYTKALSNFNWVLPPITFVNSYSFGLNRVLSMKKVNNNFFTLPSLHSQKHTKRPLFYSPEETSSPKVECLVYSPEFEDRFGVYKELTDTAFGKDMYLQFDGELSAEEGGDPERVQVLEAYEDFWKYCNLLNNFSFASYHFIDYLFLNPKRRLMTRFRNAVEVKNPITTNFITLSDLYEDFLVPYFKLYDLSTSESPLPLSARFINTVDSLITLTSSIVPNVDFQGNAFLETKIRFNDDVLGWVKIGFQDQDSENATLDSYNQKQVEVLTKSKLVRPVVWAEPLVLFTARKNNLILNSKMAKLLCYLKTYEKSSLILLKKTNKTPSFYVRNIILNHKQVKKKPKKTNKFKIKQQILKQIVSKFAIYEKKRSLLPFSTVCDNSSEADNLKIEALKLLNKSRAVVNKQKLGEFYKNNDFNYNRSQSRGFKVRTRRRLHKFYKLFRFKYRKPSFTFSYTRKKKLQKVKKLKKSLFFYRKFKKFQVPLTRSDILIKKIIANNNFFLRGGGFLPSKSLRLRNNDGANYFFNFKNLLFRKKKTTLFVYVSSKTRRQRVFNRGEFKNYLHQSKFLDATITPFSFINLSSFNSNNSNISDLNFLNIKKLFFFNLYCAPFSDYGFTNISKFKPYFLIKTKTLNYFTNSKLKININSQVFGESTSPHLNYKISKFLFPFSILENFFFKTSLPFRWMTIKKQFFSFPEVWLNQFTLFKFIVTLYTTSQDMVELSNNSFNKIKSFFVDVLSFFSLFSMFFFYYFNVIACYFVLFINKDILFLFTTFNSVACVDRLKLKLFLNYPLLNLKLVLIPSELFVSSAFLQSCVNKQSQVFFKNHFSFYLDLKYASLYLSKRRLTKTIFFKTLKKKYKKKDRFKRENRTNSKLILIKKLNENAKSRVILNYITRVSDPLVTKLASEKNLIFVSLKQNVNFRNHLNILNKTSLLQLKENSKCLFVKKEPLTNFVEIEKSFGGDGDSESALPVELFCVSQAKPVSVEYKKKFRFIKCNSNSFRRRKKKLDFINTFFFARFLFKNKEKNFTFLKYFNEKFNYNYLRSLSFSDFFLFSSFDYKNKYTNALFNNIADNLLVIDYFFLIFSNLRNFELNYCLYYKIFFWLFQFFHRFCEFFEANTTSAPNFAAANQIRKMFPWWRPLPDEFFSMDRRFNSLDDEDLCLLDKSFYANLDLSLDFADIFERFYISIRNDDDLFWQQLFDETDTVGLDISQMYRRRDVYYNNLSNWWGNVIMFALCLSYFVLYLWVGAIMPNAGFSLMPLTGCSLYDYFLF